MGRRALGCVVLLVALLAVLDAGCGGPAQPPRGPAGPGEDLWFADVTKEWGLDFVHDAGRTGSYFMPQIMGSGVALFDYDGDGLLDVYLLQNGGPNGAKNRLYHQLPDKRFVDVSADSGLDIAGHNMGVAVGDVNNDGRPDVLVTQYGAIKLFLNRGGGRFTDVSAEVGIQSPLWATSAAFLDYDRDGWLDFVVVNYIDYDATVPCLGQGGKQDYCSPTYFKGTATKLFRNRGLSGTAAGLVSFDDVTLESGFATRVAPGLGVACADFDGDGWPDVFVANDEKPNHLWINRRNGTFEEQAAVRGVAVNAMGRAEAGMGVALGDVDGDGMFDLFVTHLLKETHTLWMQGPRGLFQDRTGRSGLAAASRRTGFGTLLGDFNNDGSLDLVVINGGILRDQPRNDNLGPYWSRYALCNQLLRNDGRGGFRDASSESPTLCGDAIVGRGLAIGDLDNDGRLDLVTTQISGRATIYRNIVRAPGHWIAVQAIDPALHRDAYGAEVVVRAGSQTWLRLIDSGGSYLSSNDPRAHFGLGAVQHVDAIDVKWPDGKRERFPGGRVDRLVSLRKHAGTPLE